jgi:exodeoxyribonuclease V alpha subunit
MIPEHETAFAMTIHKSQGSEYKKVMIVMPNRDNEKLFTKELLYTAITRAQEEVNIWCNEEIFKSAACRKAECSSGLTERLKL